MTLASAGSAGATLSLGQLAPAVADTECIEGFDAFQFQRREGRDYIVTEDGVITSWSTNARAGAGQGMTFKVFRPNGAGGYSVVAHDGPRPLAPSTINTFRVRIPVKPNDIIGINTDNASPGTPNACSFLGVPPDGSEEDDLYLFLGSGGDGASLPAPVENRKLRVNVAATLLAPPQINILGHVSLGSISGGGSVVLEGNHFEEVTGVSFGGVAAKSFTVSDEHHVTAVVPRGKTLAGMAVAVTTVAGTATSTPFFFYSGCQVPKLVGKPVKTAKVRLKASGCKAAVKLARGPKGKKGKVLAQKPKAGQILAPGAKVSLKVGR